MTKGSASWRLRDNALSLLLLVFFMFGCGSTSQPERPAQIASAAEPLPETKTETQHSATIIAAEPHPVAEADEKNSIFFSLGSSTINQSERNKLRDFCTLLKSNKAFHVTLVGHANDNGSSSFNLAVADARVQSVATALIKSGVKPHQIKRNIVGDGKASRACKSQECRRKMRRVELVISANQPR